MTAFVSLHNQTNFSILDSLSSTKDLFARAKELEQPAIAITDHGTFGAAWEALKLSKSTGVKLIIGCEFFFSEKEDDKLRHVILLAKNAEGYKNILTINRKGFDNNKNLSKKAVSIINWDMLEKHSEGVICLTACGNGIISQLLMRKEFDKAEETLLRLYKIYGDNLGIEVQPNNMKRNGFLQYEEVDQQFLNRQLINLGKKHNIKVVAACNSQYVNKEDYDTHDILLAIGSHQPVHSGFRLKYNVPEFYLKSGEEVKNFFKRNYGEESAEEFCANSLYFANMCEEPEWIDPKFTNPSGKELAMFPVSSAKDYTDYLKWLETTSEFNKNLPEDQSYLRFRCESALKKHLENISPDMHQTYIDRVNDELETLEKQNFCSYMLIVADYLQWCVDNDISIGPGRGCLTGDTKVLTENGFKLLREVSAQDKVYTHTGTLNKVLHTFKYPVNEELIEFKTENSFGLLKMTSDHKVFASKSIDEAPQWIEAKNLTYGNYVYNTFPKYIKDEFFSKWNLSEEDSIKIKFSNKSETSLKQLNKVHKLDFEKLRKFKLGIKELDEVTLDKLESTLAMYGTSVNAWKAKDNSYFIKSEIKLSDDLLYVLGRWVGDGSHRYLKNGITFAFNADDENGIKKINEYFISLGMKPSVTYSKKSKSVTMTICIKQISKMFEDIFPNYYGNSQTKHMPNFFRDLSKRQLKILLNGYQDSDGCITKKFPTESAKTVSSQLICELKEICNYLGFVSSVHTEEGKLSIDKSGISRNAQTAYLLRFTGNKLERRKKYIFDNGYYSKITDISTCKDDFVYDITVENDNSYLTSSGVVHNSVGGCFTGFLLGIHQADSIKYGLIFERFQNKDKTSFPDCDCDVATSGRYALIDYVEKKYGTDYVCAISNYNTITPKVYAKDLSRALELGGSKPEAVIVGNLLADMIPSEVKASSIDGILERLPLLAETVKTKYPQIKKYGGKIKRK